MQDIALTQRDSAAAQSGVEGASRAAKAGIRGGVTAPFAEGYTELDTILQQTWDQLIEGAKRSAEPFHLGVLATCGRSGPSLRTVVLRDALPEDRRLLCHTDRRGAKVTDIGADPRVAWLFYDSSRKIQVRMSGQATVHVGNALARARWEYMRLSARRCYLSAETPGSHRASAGSPLPAEYQARAPNASESEGGWHNFAVIECRVEAIDWLKLNASGHTRAQFRWTQDGWAATWVAP